MILNLRKIFDFTKAYGSIQAVDISKAALWEPCIAAADFLFPSDFSMKNVGAGAAGASAPFFGPVRRKKDEPSGIEFSRR